MMMLLYNIIISNKNIKWYHLLLLPRIVDENKQQVCVTSHIRNISIGKKRYKISRVGL